MNRRRYNNSPLLTIPDRWPKCPRRGDIIAEKFLPFKTPLDEKFLTELEPTDYFTPRMLLSSLKSDDRKIGLWIDLTNTDRFYDRKVIEGSDIKYVKLKCRGHGECPDQDMTHLFIQLCSNFIRERPFDLILVHCTHGFNRTGFLICAFLCDQFDWDIAAAVSAFAACRPPGIYKDYYLRELFRRYGEVHDTPRAPLYPCWGEEQNGNVSEDDDEPSASQGSSQSNGMRSGGRNREFIKKDAKFMDGITGVEVVKDLAKIHEIQNRIQSMCKWKKAGFPGSQPVSMSYQNIRLLETRPYKVSWKADGTRYMMLIDGKDEVYFADRDNAIFQVVEGCPLFPYRKDTNQHLADTLLDGEMVIDVVDDKQFPRFLAYDIIRFRGLEVGGTDFNTRTLCIEKEIIQPRNEAKQKGIIDYEAFSVRIKQFWDLHFTKSFFSEKFQKTLSHELDGLIFQPVPDPYQSGQSPNVLKWKPPSHNSIDFRVKIVKEQGAGLLPETFAYLLVGRQELFTKAKATREFRENDNKIVECTFDYATNQFKFMRVRTDKSFPNSLETAQSIWDTMVRPLHKDNLLAFIDQLQQARAEMPPPNSKRHRS